MWDKILQGGWVRTKVIMTVQSKAWQGLYYTTISQGAFSTDLLLKHTITTWVWCEMLYNRAIKCWFSRRKVFPKHECPKKNQTKTVQQLYWIQAGTLFLLPSPSASLLPPSRRTLPSFTSSFSPDTVSSDRSSAMSAAEVRRRAPQPPSVTADRHVSSTARHVTKSWGVTALALVQRHLLVKVWNYRR